MRSVIIAAMAALATLAMVSVASAQNGQRQRTDAPTVRQDNSSGANGLSVEQENAIPYHPCTEALGWVNGHLVCRND
jgi:hypothetical protein